MTHSAVAMPSFQKRAERIFEHYHREEFDRALALAREAAQAHPEEAAGTTFWQACLLARLDRAEDAIRTLEAGLEEGLWWGEDLLRGDEDLVPLQGLPEFERVVAVCRPRQAEAQQAARAERLVLPPADGDGPYPLLLALHGRNSNARRAASSWQAATDMGWLLALPQSSRILSPDRFGWEDPARAETEIRSHLRELREEHPLDATRVVLAGFSQGAAVAIHLALNGAVPARAFFAVAPAVRDRDELLTLLARPPDPALRGYVILGGRDFWAEAFDPMRRALLDGPIPCQLETHRDLDHAFPAPFGPSLALGLGFLGAQE